MRGLICPCYFLVVGGKKGGRSKFKSRVSLVTGCVVLGKYLIIFKQCYCFFVVFFLEKTKQKNNEVRHVGGVGDLEL